MSDLFHEDIPDQFLDQVFAVIRDTPQHTYQILTKRAERLPNYFRNRSCPKNVWLGVSVEDRRYGVPRIDHLRRVDAHIANSDNGRRDRSIPTCSRRPAWASARTTPR